MTSKEDLEKLTVAQIREKLKSRKLPTSGTKIELVTRLYEGITAEEKLLETSAGGDFDISSVNVDEVLGLDSEANLSPDKKISEPPNNGISGEKNIDSSNGNEATQVPSPEDTEKSGTKSPERNIKLPEEKELETTVVDPPSDDKKVQLKMAARLGLPIDEAKSKRAMRFGITTEEDQKTKRAQRFGLVDQPDDDKKKLARAERFGVPLKRSAEVTSDTSLGVSDEALQKRAKRFGNADTSEESSKKEARVQRFGPANS